MCKRSCYHNLLSSALKIHQGVELIRNQVRDGATEKLPLFIVEVDKAIIEVTKLWQNVKEDLKREDPS